MKAFSSLNNKGKTQEELLKEDKADFPLQERFRFFQQCLLNFHKEEETENWLSARNQVNRCPVLPVPLTCWVTFRIPVRLIQPLVSYFVSFVAVPFGELDLFLMHRCCSPTQVYNVAESEYLPSTTWLPQWLQHFSRGSEQSMAEKYIFVFLSKEKNSIRH